MNNINAIRIQMNNNSMYSNEHQQYVSKENTYSNEQQQYVFK